MAKKRKQRGNSLKNGLSKLAVTLLLVLASYIFANYIYPQISGREQIPDDGRMQVHFIDVGQGDATLIVTPNGKHILIDAGPGSGELSLMAYLGRCGVKTIDLMLLSHPHEDHIGGADRVLNQIKTEKVLVSPSPSSTDSFERVLDAIAASGASMEVAIPGAVYEIDGVRVNILAPADADEENLNNDSIICRLDYGEARMIFSGDAEKEAEDALLAAYDVSELDCTLFKLGHHGSYTSNTAAFLDAMTPKYAVACCGKGNEYGHPHSEVRALLAERGIELLRTDMDGSVVFLCDGHEFDYIKSK